MKLHLFEARTAGEAEGNWGKFAVGIPDEEWRWRSDLWPEDTRPQLVLQSQGWGRQHVWVTDLATGEGAIFQHGGNARADLNRRRIWVCVLFEAFLGWLYQQDLSKIEDLPKVVELAVPFDFRGYRRPGFWYDRQTGELRIIPGPGVCAGLCLKAARFPVAGGE